MENDLQLKTTSNGRHLQMKTASNWRLAPMEIGLQWKMTSNAKWSPMGDNLQWKMTYNGRKILRVEYISNRWSDLIQIKSYTPVGYLDCGYAQPNPACSIVLSVTCPTLTMLTCYPPWGGQPFHIFEMKIMLTRKRAKWRSLGDWTEIECGHSVIRWIQLHRDTEN